MSKLKTKKWTLLYKEISKLGEGGNADVYIVEDNESGSKYALKSFVAIIEVKRRSPDLSVRL